MKKKKNRKPNKLSYFLKNGCFPRLLICINIKYNANKIIVSY
jgi:hypothetical protein